MYNHLFWEWNENKSNLNALIRKSAKTSSSMSQDCPSSIMCTLGLGSQAGCPLAVSHLATDLPSQLSWSQFDLTCEEYSTEFQNENKLFFNTEKREIDM